MIEPEGVRQTPVRELVGEAARHLGMRIRAGRAGLDRAITFPRIQKAALAVSGYVESVHPGRVQVIGSTEITYLRSKKPRWRAAVFRRICTRAPVTCFVVTGGLAPPEELVVEAERTGIPVLTTELGTPALIDQLQRFLDERLAPRTTVHGDLLDVYGLGVLLMGESGIGKSECALELVARGHRLVADDVVEVRRETDVLTGYGPELTKYHMEIRGLGLLNIRDLFGISAVRSRKFIELAVLLEPWQEGRPYDRLGLDEARYTILDVDLPLVRMPVAPGRNLAILVEVASRNQLLKMKGLHAARILVEKMTKEIDRGTGRGSRRPRGGDGDEEPRRT